jgi:hypothetical protein
MKNFDKKAEIYTQKPRALIKAPAKIVGGFCYE